MFRLSLAVLLFISNIAVAHVPPGQGPFYYKIGGGNEYPLPETSEVHTVPLRLGAVGKLNYTCGRLDPKRTMVNSLNNVRDSVHNIGGDLMNNIKSGIGALPMYMLQRANPGLYDLVNKYILGAFDQFKLSSNNCSKMESLISQGKNPYEDWLVLSTRSGWKKSLSVNLDANKASEDAKRSQDGDKGLPWLGGELRGGANQLPIKVTTDIAIAGFNALVGRNRAENDISSPRFQHILSAYWQSPIKCAEWITQVVGDHTIATKMKDPETESTPGFGLKPNNEATVIDITSKLAALVRNHEMPSVDNLKAVSAPGVEITIDAIYALQAKDTAMQNILVRKIAEDVALAITVDYAYTAKRVLYAGANVPNVRQATPAQIEIKRAISYLDQEVQDLINISNLRQKTVSNTLKILLEDQAQNQAIAVQMAGGETIKAPTIENGAATK